jgi:dolichol-phosphate mannosyltransferase
MIQLDADLQDPPSMINNFLIEWEKGYKIVYGIRNSRKGSKFDRLFRHSGYKFLSWATNNALHDNVGDFKLIDRDVVNELKKRNYVNPYLRGVISSLGFREKGIAYERDIRKVGSSKISVRKSLKLGLIGLASFSTKPIRIFIPISLLFTFLSIVGIFWVLFLNIIESDLPRGFSITQILIFISIGLNSIFAAIAGDYLHKIYKAIHPTTEGYISESI